jgi:hypothetical protein
MDVTRIFADEIGKVAVYEPVRSVPPPASVKAIVKVLKTVLAKNHKHSMAKEVGEAVATAISKKKRKKRRE